MSVQAAGLGATWRRESAGRPLLLSAPAFDWIYITLVVLAEVGISLDAWSHGTYGPDQSVLSEYHLLMYGSIGALAAFLAYVAASQMQAGASWRNALPVGYLIGALGVLLFGASGAVDLVGHALFGFENGIEALLSPSHLGLLTGLVMLRLAPPLAIGTRQRMGAHLSWPDLLPAVISVALLFLTFAYLVPASPLIGMGADLPTHAAREASRFNGIELGLSGVLLQTIVVIGVMVWLLRTVKLPVGALTLISGLTALLMASMTLNPRFLPVWLAAGIAGDVVLVLARSIKEEAWRLRLFGFVVPIALWGAYFVLLIVSNAGGGVWWTGYIWTGIVAQAAVAGLLLATLATLPPSVSGDAR